MKRFCILVSILWLATCGGGGDKATGPEEPPVVVNLTSLTGQAQKGPFNNGTSINVAELLNTLSPTGRNFSSAITDNTGRFSVANVQLESPFVELRATGFYFNEVSNNISDAQLTLYALSDLTNKSSLNVNILTHLEKNRMQVLMSGDNPKTFAQAKLQAQEEVLTIFDYSRANMPASELLDISQGGAANAKLLAISAILQGDQTVGQMSELLANISTDLSADGALDDSNLQSQLISNTQGLDFAEIRSNLSARFTALGITATIPDFETEINQFLKPPVAQDISASTAEDTAINITLAGSDPEDESLTYTILEVNNATVTLNGNVANYTPNTNFYGTDTFTYYANDGTSDSNIATVTMTVSGEDDDPNTLDVTTTTDEDVTVDVTLSAEEYDGDSYSFAIISDVSNGATSLNGSVVTYTPNQDWNGEDTFTFEATDDAGRNMNVATATIIVNPINDNPTMRDTTFTFVEDCPPVQDEDYCVDIDVLDFLFNDIDSMSGNASVTLNSEPQHGSLALQGARFLYNPNKDWYGEDVMTYVVNDGDGGVSNVASINLIATPVNDAPVTEDQTASTNEDTAVNITLTATDVENDNLTFTIVSDVSNGTTALSGTTVTYTPTANFNGTDTFTFKANDGTDDSNTSTVTITVASVNDAPVANDVTASTQSRTGNMRQAVTITLDATDVDGDDLTYSLVSDVSNGTTSLSGNIVTYTPTANYDGTDTFTYKANDGTVDSNIATGTITVENVNFVPVLRDTTISRKVNDKYGDGNIQIDLNSLLEDDSDNFSFSIVDNPTKGSASIISNLLIFEKNSSSNDNHYSAFFPTVSENGTFHHLSGGISSDTVSVKVNDGEHDSNVATITINYKRPYNLYIRPNNGWNHFHDAYYNNSDDTLKLIGYSYKNYIFALKIDASNGEYISHNANWNNQAYDGKIIKTSDDNFLIYEDDGIPRLWKIDNNSGDIWERSINPTASSSPGGSGLIETSDQNIVLAYQKSGVAKLNTDATELIWHKTLGHSSTIALEKTSDNKLVVIGIVNNQYIVQRIDEDGNSEWEKLIDAENVDSGQKVLLLPIENGEFILGFRGDNENLYKFDVSGNYEVIYNYSWTLNNASNSESLPGAIIQTSDGGIIFSGSGGNFPWVIKLDASFNEQWNLYGNESYNNILQYSKNSGGGGNAFSIIQEAADGGFILIGSSHYQGSWIVPSVQKIDSSGNLVWPNLSD